MAKHKLTDNFVKNFPAPEKRTEIYDELVTGLVIRVTPTGSKSFVFRYRFAGRTRRYTLGKYPTLKTAIARDVARELHKKVIMGVDPMSKKKEREQQPKELTVHDLFREFKMFHYPSLREKTKNEYERIYLKEVHTSLGNYIAKNVTTRQIRNLLDDKAITKGYPTMANRLRTFLHKLFNIGIDRGILEINPVSKTNPYAHGERSKERFYTEEEIHDLWYAFDQQPEPARSVFKILLLTAQRSKETRHMRWDDIKNGIWTIPSHLAKNKKEHTVPLSSTALDVIEGLRESRGNSEYVFESTRKPNFPLNSLKRPKEDVRDLSLVKDFTPHDLRRTAATYMAKLKIDRTVLGKIMNHKGMSGDSKVTAIYDRFDYLDERKRALEMWASYLNKIIEGHQAKIHKIS